MDEKSSKRGPLAGLKKAAPYAIASWLAIISAARFFSGEDNSPKENLPPPAGITAPKDSEEAERGYKYIHSKNEAFRWSITGTYNFLSLAYSGTAEDAQMLCLKVEEVKSDPNLFKEQEAYMLKMRERFGWRIFSTINEDLITLDADTEQTNAKISEILRLCGAYTSAANPTEPRSLMSDLPDYIQQRRDMDKAPEYRPD